jgi:hypothetical protein
MPQNQLSNPRLAASFWEGYSAGTTGEIVDAIAHTENDVNTATGEFAFLDQVPKPSEKKGALNVTELGAKKIVIRNKVWRNAVGFDMDDVRRDQTGSIVRAAAALGEVYGVHDLEVLVGLLADGETGEAYDQLAFYASSGRTFSNIITASEVASLNVADPEIPTAEEVVVSVLDIIGYMQSWQDSQGHFFNRGVRSFHVGMPTKMFGSMQTAMTTNGFSDSRPDTLQKLIGGYSVTLAPEPAFNAQATKIHVQVTDRVSAKAMIKQVDVPLMLSELAAGSEEEFLNERHILKGREVSGYGYGSPQCAAVATFS